MRQHAFAESARTVTGDADIEPGVVRRRAVGGMQTGGGSRCLQFSHAGNDQAYAIVVI